MLYGYKPNIRAIGFVHAVLDIQNLKSGKLKNNLNFNTVGENQNSWLRGALNFRINFFRTERDKQSIMSRGINFYNELPNEIKELQSINVYKKKYQIICNQ